MRQNALEGRAQGGVSVQHLGQQVAREGVGDGGELLLLAPVRPLRVVEGGLGGRVKG